MVSVYWIHHQDLTGQPEQVVAICNVAWTPEVIANYQSAMEKSALNNVI